ncbi:hypothetical protein HK097_004026 [Rhizophlyctis rosea]|uniref:Uncharacterized protein n=1 Tax=Rhizophlyctis rosea TaxID=64517 RepID=A0AAD5SLT8_9FUNG|nr:hypothetical protein HK097_004026 [Rhizophlyctis rosea]
MEARYKAEKDQMAADSKGIWKAVEEVKQAGNLGGLDDIERRTVEGLGVRLKPHGVVEAVEIPV